LRHAISLEQASVNCKNIREADLFPRPANDPNGRREAGRAGNKAVKIELEMELDGFRAKT
jgi:hypothetical protein